MKTETTTPTLASLDSFTRAYVDAMLWTEEEGLKEDASQHEDEHEPATRWDVNVHCIAPDALAKIVADCRAFQEAEEENLTEAYEGHDEYGYEQAGHDFWLNRNHHGTGFWDRGLGKVGHLLSDGAHATGSSDLYFGDDGLLYVA